MGGANSVDNQDYQSLVLDGVTYVVVKEDLFSSLCKKARISSPGNDPLSSENALGHYGVDRTLLAERLRRRRRAADLTQAELAAKSGLRQETISRIENARCDPDFATIRRLVEAIQGSPTPL